MHVLWKITKHADHVNISLYEFTDRENYDPIDIIRIIDKKTINNLTSVIQKSSFSHSIAYTMWKQFNETMQAKLIKASFLIEDEKLKKELLTYSANLAKSLESVMTEEEFEEFAEDIEKNIQFLM